MPSESYSVSKAARILGVSIPTLKRMAEDRELETFRTPGGHLRIAGESLESLRQPKQARATREPSPVLANRRERVEELALEAQELRAQRDIEKLRREQAEEQAQAEAEAEAQEHQAERDAEAVKLRRERLRLQEVRERERREAERRLAAFRCNCLKKATESLPDWVSPRQRKEAFEALEAEIAKRQPHDEPLMPRILAEAVAGLIAPWEAERKAQEEREKATRQTLSALSVFATDAERARARAAIRKALETLPTNAEDFEICAVAKEVVQPIKQAVEKRLLDEQLIEWAVRELPLWGRAEEDEAHLRRECAEILAELPTDVSEAEAKDELRQPVRDARKEIEEREARKERKRRKAALIQQGLFEVPSYLLHLKSEGEISREEFWDSGLTADLTEAVKEALEGELIGDEDAGEVKEFVREIIDEELDVQPQTGI